LSTPISARLCGLRSNARMSHQDVGRGCCQRVSGQRLPLGRDDLGVPFPLCFCLAGHRPLHALGQLNVLEIDQGDHLSPVGGLHVQDPLDVDVDPVSLGHRLIKAVLTDPLAQGGLRDLVDRRCDVLDRDHRLHDDAVVGEVEILLQQPCVTRA